MFKKHLSIKKIRQLLLDDLSIRKKEMMEIHLKDCRRCSELMDEEKAIFDLLKKHPAWYPTADFLNKSRKQLIAQLGSPQNRKNVKTFQPKPAASPIFAVPRLQWAVMIGIFVIGLITGRFLLTNDINRRSSFIAGNNQAGFTIPVSQVDVMPVDGGFHEVQIKFTTINEETVQGRINDPEIQNILFNLIRYAPQDNIRLKVVNLLQQMKSSPSTQSALVYALEKDENPGIRMKAIKILDDLPLNEELVKILKNSFLKDNNPGIRVKAAETLSRRWHDPDITPILENEAKNDEYIRALMIMNETNKNKQQTRNM